MAEYLKNVKIDKALKKPSPLYHTIKQMVATRWNSAYTLLLSVINMWEPLMELVNTASSQEGISNCYVSEDHWMVFRDLTKVLKVSYG
jgi:hypothetical protein